MRQKMQVYLASFLYEFINYLYPIDILVGIRDISKKSNTYDEREVLYTKQVKI